MKKYKYPVFAFRQQRTSPVQVTFVAHAGELLEWAGVPRKSDELLTGYQRFKDDTRIAQEIVPFFQNERNCSPTALIVALRKDSGLGKCSLDEPNIVPGQIVPTNLHIEVDDDAFETDAVFESASKYVNERIKSGGNSTGTISPMAEEGDEDDEDETEEEVEAEEGEAIPHLGATTLQRMKSLLDDEANWSKPEFRKAVIDYVKPASIIDGQHRAFAAARIGNEGLPFIVCGLYDTPWEEQVFQFTVVNLKPKRIPPSLITSIAGLSLTRNEQDKVEQRLEQAGIRMSEVTIMSLVAYDDKSPFAEKVDMSVSPEEKEGKLGYGGMKRIAKEWFTARRTSLTQIAKSAYDTNSVSRARLNWRSERIWFDMFCAFWNEVRTRNPTLWEKTPANKLFVGAHLWALQEAILKQADGQVPSHWQIPSSLTSTDDRIKSLQLKLLEVITATLNYFPPEMWTTTWAKASQDTTAGRKELVALFDQFIDEGKKSGTVWKNWLTKGDWFKKQS